MNRKLIVTIITTAMYLFGAGAADSASFGDIFGGKKAKAMLEEKEQACQAKLDEKDRQYQHLVEEGKDSKDTVQSLRAKNSTLMEAYEKLKMDQKGVMEQLSRLRRDSQRCTTIKGSFDQMTEENQAFHEKRESLEKEKEALKTTLGHLKLHVKEVTAEKDQLAVFLAEAQESEDVKVKKIRESVKDEVGDLKNQIRSFKKENDTLTKYLKQSQKDSRFSEAASVELRGELEISRSERDALEERHRDLKSENRQIAQEAALFPKKFADLARHNRKLVRETADMHYNLGVSCIKNKEYKRAVKEFKKVLELKPQDAYANYNLGYIYAEHLVDRPTAIKYFQTYLAHASDAKDANWVRKYILTWQTWYGKEQMK